MGPENAGGPARLHVSVWVPVPTGRGGCGLWEAPGLGWDRPRQGLAWALHLHDKGRFLWETDGGQGQAGQVTHGVPPADDP